MTAAISLKTIATIAIIGLTISILLECFTLYFMQVGGTIIWASPLIPMSDWGKQTPLGSIIVIAASLFAIFILWVRVCRQQPR